MAAPTSGLLETAAGGLPLVRDFGLNTAKASNFGGTTISATGTVVVPTGSTLTVTDTAGLLAGSIIVPNHVQLAANLISATTTSYTLYVNDNVSGTYKVVGASAVFGTASTSGTLQVEVATGTQAVGSGTNQLTGTVSLSGTANTTVNGTVIASPTTIAAGSRINLIFAGTMTSLADCAVTVSLQRLS